MNMPTFTTQALAERVADAVDRTVRDALAIIVGELALLGVDGPVTLTAETPSAALAGEVRIHRQRFEPQVFYGGPAVTTNTPEGTYVDFPRPGKPADSSKEDTPIAEDPLFARVLRVPADVRYEMFNRLGLLPAFDVVRALRDAGESGERVLAERAFFNADLFGTAMMAQLQRAVDDYFARVKS